MQTPVYTKERNCNWSSTGTITLHYVFICNIIRQYKIWFTYINIYIYTNIYLWLCLLKYNLLAENGVIRRPIYRRKKWTIEGRETVNRPYCDHKCLFFHACPNRQCLHITRLRVIHLALECKLYVSIQCVSYMVWVCIVIWVILYMLYARPTVVLPKSIHKLYLSCA